MTLLFREKTISSLLTVLAMSILLSACSKNPDNQIDPFEKSNRAVFKFNDTLDTAILKPTAKAYVKVVPWPVRDGVNNFFSNLSELPTLANDLIQGKSQLALNASIRFVVNSTLGIGGVLDVATGKGVPKHTQDFGLTLAKWGNTESPYLVVPFLGSSTVRDTVGWGVDYFFTVFPYIDSDALSYGLMALNAVDKRSTFLNAEQIIEQASLDPYVFQRDAYLQHRHYLMHLNSENSDPYIESDSEDDFYVDTVDVDVEAAEADVVFFDHLILHQKLPETVPPLEASPAHQIDIPLRP